MYISALKAEPAKSADVTEKMYIIGI